MKQCHTSAPKGKRIYVRLKTGERFIDKFVKNEGKFVYFENHVVKSGDIKAFAIFRAKFVDKT